MRHAVLGAGGVGTFLGAALARVGRDVLLLMREESLAAYGGVVHVESALLGDFEAEVPAAASLDRDVDALWVTTKATQLAGAVERVPATDAVVVPLLNGLEHVGLCASVSTLWCRPRSRSSRSGSRPASCGS